MSLMVLVGQRFGQLHVTVAHKGGPRGHPVQWFCRCDCGEWGWFRTGNLRGGHTISCGCVKRAIIARGANRRHGHALTVRRTPTYRSWDGMIGRCEKPRHISYPTYGGRGIKVSERWHTFAHFLADMGERPVGRTIDRIDNNGNYELGNCRWATQHEQRINARHRRSHAS